MQFQSSHIDVAFEVLEQIKARLVQYKAPKYNSLTGKQLSEKPHLEAYANGREQGFAIVTPVIANMEKQGIAMISFSEARCTDQIVVYVSDTNEYFSMQGNVPTERAWNSAHFFNTSQEAADFIVKTILNLSGL